MRHLLFLLALYLPATLAAAPDFPALSGRVVDQAQMLSPEEKSTLSQALQQFERDHGSQFVVATLTDLQGYAISDYAYQLGRHWNIGHQEDNNGVLLLIAPEEKQLWIATGYGLEGALPDALASHIIHTEMLPAFQAGQASAGIFAGAQAIMQAVKGEYQGKRVIAEDIQHIIGLAIMMLIFAIHIYAAYKNTRGGGLYTLGHPGLRKGRESFGRPYGLRHGGFGSGGGFRGGGGSFGGGGAGGSW